MSKDNNKDTGSQAPGDQSVSTGGVLEIMDKVNASGLRLQKSYELIEVTPFTPNTGSPAIVTLNGTTVLRAGHLAGLIAHMGYGKSSICEAVLSAAMTAMHDPDAMSKIDTIGFQVDPKTLDGRKVLYWDCEQEEADIADIAHRMAKRTGLIWETVDEYRKDGRLLMRGAKTIPGGRQRFMEFQKFLEEHQKEFALVILDGYGELIPDVNDIAGVDELVGYLDAIAAEQRLGIFGTIHSNPNQKDPKPRGHLGSQLLRTCETVISLTKPKDAPDLRLVGFGGFYTKSRKSAGETIQAMRYDEDARMFLSFDYVPDKKGLNAADQLTSIFENADTSISSGLSRKELSDALQREAKLTTRRGVDKRIEKYVGNGQIKLRDDGKYYCNI